MNLNSSILFLSSDSWGEVEKKRIFNESSVLENKWKCDPPPAQSHAPIVCTPCSLLERSLPGIQSPWRITELVNGCHTVVIDQKYVKKVKTVRPPTLGWGPSTLTSAPLSSSTPMVDSCPPSMWSAPRCAEDKTYYRSTVDQIPLPCLCWLLWGLPPVFFQPFCPCDKGSPPWFNGQGALCNVIWKQLRCKLITKLNLNSLFVAKHGKVDSTKHMILVRLLFIKFWIISVHLFKFKGSPDINDLIVLSGQSSKIVPFKSHK